MTRSLLLPSALLLFLAGPALAESQTFELNLMTAEDRTDVPIKVLLTLPDSLGKAQAVTVQDAAGKAIPAQLTAPALLTKNTAAGQRELNFVLARIKAGEPAVLKATVSTGSPAAGTGFAWHDKAGEYAELRFGDRPVLRYMYKAYDASTKEVREQTYKVYHHLFDPAGKRLVTKGPGGQYTHHRGLYYGFNNISYGTHKKVDTWHCPGNTHQSHAGFLATEAGPVLGRHRVKIDWHGPDGLVFAEESRELTVYHVSGGTLVEFASVLRSKVGPVKLDGDPQHAGFHFRADNEVSAKTAKQTCYLRPDGKGKPGETRNWPQVKDHVNLPWNVMSFVLGEQRYSAAYLDRPANPKEARFSERDYGRFGSYFAYEMDEKKPLEVNYRLWLQEGEMTGPAVGSLSTNFVKSIVVGLK